MTSGLGFALVAIAAVMTSVGGVKMTGPNMNGEYRLSVTPGANGNFSTNFKDYPGGVEYFEVYHGPINTTYGEVWWTKGSNPIPDEIVKRFDGKVMAIVGIEMDQVRQTPEGDVSVPITLAYNHHHDTAVVGKGTTLIEADRNDPRVVQSPYGNRHYVRLDKGKAWIPDKHTSESGFPTSAMFSDGNGGEYRKTLHMAPPGYAQLVESPYELSGSPMQIDTWNRDKMNLTGGKFVSGPVPKHSLAPLSGPDAKYSGLLECPLTTRIQKVFQGGSSGWNDTFGAAVFDCPGEEPAGETWNQLINKFNDQCLNVMGMQVADGSPMSTWTCVHQSNEAFSFDAKAGQMVEQHSGKCVVNSGCSGKATLCIAKCPTTPTWKMDVDGSIRSAVSSTSCLQVTSKNLNAGVFLAPCATPPTPQQLWMTASLPSSSNQCDTQVGTAETCFEAARNLAGLANASVTTKSVTDAGTPPGCSVVASGDGSHAQVIFNYMNRSTACCSPGDTVVGTMTSLVRLSLEVAQKNATITISGPSDVWFGVGFGATLMDDMPYAIIVEGTGTVSERQLAKESPGVLLNSSVAVVSNTVVGGSRTVVLTRHARGQTKQHYSFSQTALNINIINAIGSTPTLSYHKAKTAASIALFPGGGQPACICSYPAASFGQATGSIKYLPTGEEIGFPANRCAAQPREDILAMKNPTCDVRAYVGGLMTCHHQWILLDAEQEQPWQDQPLVYYKKFRIYFQEYDPSKHLNLQRHDWGIGADGDHSEYDVIQCPSGTPPEQCTQYITGTWTPVPASSPNMHLVKAHFHCHAPTCIRMELWNNDTGKLLCREEGVYGGTGMIDEQRFNEPGYIAVPPCLWGSPTDGLEPPPLMSGVTIKVTSLTNNTYGHHGEMALPELSLVQLPAEQV